MNAGVAQSPDALLNGARNSMARGGVVKSSSSVVPNSNIRGSAQVAGASTSTSTSTSQVQVPAHENRVVNGNSTGVSSTPNEVADALRDMTLDSYVPESWMLQKSNNDTKQLLHLIVVGSHHLECFEVDPSLHIHGSVYLSVILNHKWHSELNAGWTC